MSRSIEAFPIEKVKEVGFPLDDVPGFPLGEDELRELLTNLPVVLTSPESDVRTLPFNDDVEGIGTSRYEMIRPSENHGRSFLLTDERLTQPWKDEHGNEYSAITLKGNYFARPWLQRTLTSSEGYMAHGLQESAIIERVGMASAVLRAAGVSTEHVMGLAEPKLFPWPVMDGHKREPSETDAHEMISLEEYKRRAIKKYWKFLPEQERTSEALQDLLDKFEDMTFYVSLRATDTPYRILDLYDPKIKKEVYEYVNQNHLPEGEELLDHENYADFDRYLKLFLLPRAAVNMARMHSLGLVHKFPHTGNVTAYGGIVDLDSVYGKALDIGDDFVEIADIVKDIHYILTDIKDKDEKIFPYPESRVDAYREFMRHYMDEQARLFETEADGYEKYMTHFLQHMLYHLERVDDWGKYHAWNEVVRYSIEKYCQDYLKIDTENWYTNMDEVLLDAMDVYDTTDGMLDKWKDIVRQWLDLVTPDILSELSYPIADAYQEGRRLDVAKLFVENKSVGAIARMELVDELARRMVNKGIEHLTEDAKRVADGEDMYMDVHWRFYESLMPGEKSVTRDHLMDVLNEKILPALIDDIRQEVDYAYPRDVCPNHGRARVGGFWVTEKRWWIHTDGVPVLHIYDALDEDVEMGQSEFVRKNEYGNFIIGPSDKNSRVVQIVSDGEINGSHIWSVEDHELEIEFNEDKPPVYIAIIEENEEGELRARLQANNSEVAKSLQAAADMITVAIDKQDPQLALFEIEK